METRIQRLEADVAAIKADVAVLRANCEQFATKADLHELANSLIKWVVGTALGLGVAAVTVITFVLNYAVPMAPATPAPIVITVPYPIQQNGLPLQTPPSK